MSRTYRCEKCHSDDPHGLAGGMCGPCLRELDALEPGDQVTYPQGSGAATGWFVCRNRGRGTMKIETASGKHVFKKELHVLVG